MYCLSCGKDGLDLNTQICPRCNAYLPSLTRDLLQNGDLLDRGKYSIEYPIGRGGFGVTYKAIHTELNLPVAIKEFYPKEIVHRDLEKTELIVPKDKQAKFQKGLDRFLKEAKILNRIEHPNIVKVRDYLTENNTAYIVMNLISGNTLASAIKSRRNHRLPPARVKEIVTVLVDAIDTIHQASIYHLDIKPENILITKDNKLVLVDFGASKQGLANKETTRSCTLAYAPPELISGGQIGPFSDIFELGATIYEMLTGKKPPNSVDRLVKDTWQAQDLQQPWRDLVESALKLSEKERPSDIKKWWENSCTQTITYSELPEIIRSDRDRIDLETLKTKLEPVDRIDRNSKIFSTTQNKKYSMKINYLKSGITLAGMIAAVMGAKTIGTFEFSALVGSTPTISAEKISVDLKGVKLPEQTNLSDAKTYYDRGNLYYDLKQWDLAIAEYTKAIETNPNYAPSYNNRGIIYRKLKQWDLALNDYNKAIELNPNYAKVYNNRGNVYKDLNQFDLALANFDRAIEIKPNYSIAYSNRGIVHRKLKQWDLALADYNKAIAINPNYTKAYNNRGNVYKDLNQFDLALDDYNKAIEINPNYAKAYKNRAQVWMSLGELEKSEQDLQKAVQLL